VSVDTNVKGKNLGAYRTLRHDGVRILITPTLFGLVESMRVVTKGMRSRTLAVEFAPVERQRTP
jgi:hypothetical protein